MQETVKLALPLALPLLGAALVVGLAVSLFQAVTQIHEMTLTFVPVAGHCRATGAARFLDATPAGGLHPVAIQPNAPIGPLTLVYGVYV